MVELREDEALAITQLREEGDDPYIYAWQEQPDGTIRYKPLGTAFRTPTRSTATYIDKKRRRTLPLVEAKALHEFAPWLRYFCQGVTKLWCGDVTLDRPCLVKEVAMRREETVTAIRRFFEKCRFDVELIFTILHDEGCDYRDCDGNLRVNAHGHFLFRAQLDKCGEPEFRAAFESRFPVGSRVDPVKHRGKIISYILRTPNLRPLLDAGEYVNWVRVVQGKRRMHAYGLFRRNLAVWKKKRKKIETRARFDWRRKRLIKRFYLIDRPAPRPRQFNENRSIVVPLDTFVGTTVMKTNDGLSVAAIVKNPSPTGDKLPLP